MKDELKIIRPHNRVRFVNIREIIKYKDLLFFLVLRGIKGRYAQSVLGVGWAIIQPLFATLIFTIIFGNLAGISSEGVPYFLFSLTAMIPWNYFSGTLTEASNSLVQNANMLTKVYFPRLILPLSSAFSKFLDFIIGFVILIICIAIYEIPLNWELIYLPLFMFILLLCSLGIGMILSAMAVQYRDIKHAMTFLTQILMYLAPVVYPTSKVPEKYQLIYSLNPMVGVIEGFRSVLLHTQPVPWLWLGVGAVVSLTLFFIGAIYFRRTERYFADVA